MHIADRAVPKVRALHAPITVTGTKKLPVAFYNLEFSDYVAANHGGDMVTSPASPPETPKPLKGQREPVPRG